jgi:hypothetical protein
VAKKIGPEEKTDTEIWAGKRSRIQRGKRSEKIS